MTYIRKYKIDKFYNENHKDKLIENLTIFFKDYFKDCKRFILKKDEDIYLSTWNERMEYYFKDGIFMYCLQYKKGLSIPYLILNSTSNYFNMIENGFFTYYLGFYDYLSIIHFILNSRLNITVLDDISHYITDNCLYIESEYKEIYG